MAKKHWTYLLEAEAASQAGVQIEALDHMHWRWSPVVRLVLMSFEQAMAQGQQLMKVLCKNLGDSRLIEVAHQQAKDLLRASKSDTFSNTTIMRQVLSSNILGKRGMNVVKASAAQKVQASCQRSQNQAVTKQMKASTHKLPKAIQNMMLPNKGRGASTWPTPNAAAMFQSIAATKWLIHFWEFKKGKADAGDINASWLSILAPAGKIMAQNSTSLLVKVAASAQHSFLAWQVTVEEVNGTNLFLCKPDRNHLLWLHITDLHDWVVIPSEPVVVNNLRGPLGWKRAGEAMPLHVAVCLENLKSVGVSYIKRLIQTLADFHIKGNPSRKEVEEVLFKMCLDEDKWESAWQAYQKAECEVNDGIDSEFSEVISELNQEEGNQTDLKDLKAKKRTARLKRKMIDADGPVQTKKRGRGKGKGKGRGKGRGTAKGKGKGKGGKKGSKKRMTKQGKEPRVRLRWRQLPQRHKLQRRRKVQLLPALPNPCHHLMSQCQRQPPMLPSPGHLVTQCQVKPPVLPRPDQEEMMRQRQRPCLRGLQHPRHPTQRFTNLQRRFCQNCHPLGAHWGSHTWTLDSLAGFPPAVTK